MGKHEWSLVSDTPRKSNTSWLKNKISKIFALRWEIYIFFYIIMPSFNDVCPDSISLFETPTFCCPRYSFHLFPSLLSFPHHTSFWMKRVQLILHFPVRGKIYIIFNLNSAWSAPSSTCINLKVIWVSKCVTWITFNPGSSLLLSISIRLNLHPISNTISVTKRKVFIVCC